MAHSLLISIQFACALRAAALLGLVLAAPFAALAQIDNPNPTRANTRRPQAPRVDPATLPSVYVVVLKSNPILGPVAAMELEIAERKSAQIGVSLGYNPISSVYTSFGVSVSGEYRIYRAKATQFSDPLPLSGFYYGPYLKYRYRQYNYGDNELADVAVHAVLAGATAGYQFVFGSGFTLNPYFGLGGGSAVSRINLSDNKPMSEKQPFGDNIDIRFGIALGLWREVVPAGQ